jgi:hypothetical protein
MLKRLILKVINGRPINNGYTIIIQLNYLGKIFMLAKLG